MNVTVLGAGRDLGVNTITFPVPIGSHCLERNSESLRGLPSGAARSGSRIPTTIKPIAMNAGTTANHRTRRMWSANHRIRAIASKGPETPRPYLGIGAPDTGTSAFGPSYVCHQRIPRRAANAFANTIELAGRRHDNRSGRQRKPRLGQCSEPVTDKQQPLRRPSQSLIAEAPMLTRLLCSEQPKTVRRVRAT